MAAAIEVARCRPDDIVVVLNPDSGRGYLSRVFDDDWMANFGSSATTPASARCWRPGGRWPGCSTSTLIRPSARRST